MAVFDNDYYNKLDFISSYNNITTKNGLDKRLPIDGVVKDAKTAVLIADIFMGDDLDDYDETRMVEYDSLHGLWAVKYARKPLPFGEVVVVINKRDGGIMWFVFPGQF